MLDSNLAHRGRPKKRGRPSKADKLAIELARRVAGAVSAAAAAAKASATKAREQVLKRGRGRPPKQALKIDVLGGEPSSQEDEEEEAAPVVRPKSRRKGAPRRAPGSTTGVYLRCFGGSFVVLYSPEPRHDPIEVLSFGFIPDVPKPIELYMRSG